MQQYRENKDVLFTLSPELCCDWYVCKELAFGQIMNFGLNPVMQCSVVQNSVCSWQDPQNPFPSTYPSLVVSPVCLSNQQYYSFHVSRPYSVPEEANPRSYIISEYYFIQLNIFPNLTIFPKTPQVFTQLYITHSPSSAKFPAY